MRSLVLFTLCCTAAFAVPTVYEDGVEAETCSTDVCKSSDGCRCSTSTSPLGSDETVPQVRIIKI